MFAEYRIAREVEEKRQQLNAAQFNTWLAWLFKLVGGAR